MFFTSDPHFGHKNILKYTNRGHYFNDVDEHDAILVENWNNVVRPKDEIYCLGDFALCSDERRDLITDQLNGKIHLILGNHDKKLTRNFVNKFESVQHYKEITRFRPNIILFHYAMRVWNKSHYGNWQLYGHSHGMLPEFNGILQMDVGIDCHPEYKPFHYDEIKLIMDRKVVQ